MREFGNTPPPKPWWKRLFHTLFLLFGGQLNILRFLGHDDRMRKRRRKTKFDR